MNVNCQTSRYYDLVELPHGHIPAPKVKLWRNIQIPLGKKRDESFFRCWTCGAPSFFRGFSCNYCEEDGGYDAQYRDFQAYQRREKRKLRLKKIEYAFLPLLVLFGKVRYNQSCRVHRSDSDYREPFWDWSEEYVEDMGEVEEQTTLVTETVSKEEK